MKTTFCLQCYCVKKKKKEEKEKKIFPKKKEEERNRVRTRRRGTLLSRCIMGDVKDTFRDQIHGLFV